MCKGPGVHGGADKKKANGHRVLSAGLTIEIQKVTFNKTRPGCYEKEVKGKNFLALKKI